MAINIKASSKMDLSMDMASTVILMVLSIKALSIKAKNKEKESYKLVISSILANFIKMKKMDMENKLISGDSIKGNF